MACKIRYAVSSLLCTLSAHTMAHAELKSLDQATIPGLADVGNEHAASSILITSGRIAALDNVKIDDSYAPTPQSPALAGPPEPRRWTDHVPRSESEYRTFGSQFHQIRWETLGLLGYFTVVNSPKLFKPMESFHFENEGWFGKSTLNLGVDKLTHAFDSYLLAEFLHSQLHRKTGGASGDALTASVLASGLMIYSELTDGIEKSGGFSVQDVAANTVGTAFSLLRNTVPGLKEKLDFRLLIIPNSDIYTRTGKRHYEQQRYLMALTLSGFKGLQDTPLRFVELHAGYYGSGFTNEDIARGEKPRRHIFFGVGLNLRELFFKNADSGLARRAGQALDYIQVPYTAAHFDGISDPK